MEEQQEQKCEERKSTNEENIKTTEDKKVDHAGPSGTTSLPGAIQSPKPKTLKAGLSKSDHCIRQMITCKDVSNALKSISFRTPNEVVLQKPEIKEIIFENQVQEKLSLESTTMIDMKKIVASCFKVNKEEPVTVVVETPLQAVRDETPSYHCNICNAGTECMSIPDLSNEVLVTGVLQTKISKSEKKKNSLKPDLVVGPRDSLSSIGSNVCRICMTKGRERLISPCNCKGSLANVHLTCLERWLNQVGRNHCELCGYSYPAIRTPRYTVLQALRLWFGNPRNRSHLQSDCLIFWLLSTVTAGLLAVCIVGTQYFVLEGTKLGKTAGIIARKEKGISHRITETAMDFFMAIVLCGYSVTVYLLWKDHYVMWNRWRRANVNVRLLLAPDTTPVPFAPRPGYNVV